MLLCLADVPSRRSHFREMGTVSRGQDIILTSPVKPKQKPVSNHLSSEFSRLITYLNWDTLLYGALQSLLAKAGFFYTGHEDTVECFACGVQLSDWNPSKDPVKEHEVASPNCLYKSLNESLSANNIADSFSLDYTELASHLPVKDLPESGYFTNSTMQCDGPQSNNNQVEILQSLPTMKTPSLSTNDLYRQQMSISGEDTTDMFSIADPKERCAHPMIDLLRNESCRIQTYKNWPSNAPVCVPNTASTHLRWVMVTQTD